MGVGSGALYSGESYLAIGRETTYGTYVTATAGLEFLSSGIKTVKDSKILEEVSRKRTMSRDFRLSKVVEGPVSNYVYPDMTAVAYILQNAFGGTVTTATATGETTGGAALTHTFNTGSMDQTYKSLSMNVRKGPATDGKVFRYTGARVNTLAIKAAIDEPLQMDVAYICKDSTQMSDDIETLLTATAFEPLSFASGRLSIESSLAALTTTSYWCVSAIDFTINNNLKNDANSRCIGSDTLDVLPVGVQSYEMSCQMRFDTTTAYDAMIAGTNFVGEFEFLGTTITTSSIRRGLKFRFEKLSIKDAGDPEIGGPDQILTSNVVFNVLRSESATGAAVKGFLTNSMTAI